MVVVVMVVLGMALVVVNVVVMVNPILDTRISSVCLDFSVALRVPPLDSETGCTGELWSNRVPLILEK